MAIRLLSSESIDGALTLAGNLTGTTATLSGLLTGTTATLSGLLTGTTSNFSGLSTLNGGVTMSNSILVSYTGSDGQNNDAGIKIINDASDWGLYIRKLSNADYGLRIDSGGSSAFSIYSTTGGSTKTFNVTGSNGNTAIAGSVNVGLRQAFKPSSFGYSSSYTTLIVGSAGTNYQTNATSLCFNVDISGNPSGSFNGGGMEYVYRNVGSFITPNASNNGYNTILSWNTSGGATFNNGSTFNGDVTITGNLFLPTASSYIKLGGYSYIGEDLTDQDSLTIASDSTESIYFAHFNQGSSTYTTTAEIDNDGNFIVGNVTYGSSLGQVRIINDAASSPASLSLFGYNNVADNGNYAKIDLAMQTSGTGGNVVSSIRGLAVGVGENSSDLAFYNASGGTLSEKMRIGYNGQIGIGASTNLDGRLDLRMAFSGQNWVPDGTSAKWSEVWCNTGTPGTYFNDTMLHIDTNRGGGATGGVVGIAFSPGWQGHQNWGIYSYNTTGSAYTSGDLSFVSQINGGDRFERMRLNGVNGCVGIGIDTAPASNVKLRVVGNFANEWTAEVKSTNTTGQSYGLVVNTLTSAGVYNLGCYTHTGNGFFVQNDGKVGIGTGTATEGRLHVTQSYSASLRTGYFQSSAYSAPHVVYDSLAINQQDVPCLVLVETPAAAVSTHQKLTLAVGDNNAVIRTANTSGGMWFNVNGGISDAGYLTTSGTNALRLLNSGNAILPGNVGIGTTVMNGKLSVAADDGTSTPPLSSGIYVGPYQGNTAVGSAWSYSNSAATYTDFSSRYNSSDSNMRFIMKASATPVYAMTIKGDGRVGIGTTSPSVALDVTGEISSSDDINVGGKLVCANVGSDKKIAFRRTGANNFSIEHDSSSLYFYNESTSELPIRFFNNGDVSMIAGNVGIGNTSPQTTLHTGPTTTITNVFTARFAASNFFASGGNSMFYVPDAAANIMMFGSNQFGTNQIEFYHKNPGTSQAYVGRISTSGSATSYVTSSDYRLKENIVPISESISRLNQLKPSRFNFIEEPGKVVDGFIAHEVQDIVPEAIVGEKDEVDEEGGIIPQGIDQAKLVPLLVAAVQELEARVKELENK